MAAVDLYGADAGQIRNQYKSSLGRDASDDDVTKWLNGTYGGGALPDWLRQIDSSHEAQQYRAQRQVGVPNPNVNTTLPAPPPPQSPAFDIYDPSYRQTGMGPAGSGYGPGGVENPAYAGLRSPNFQPNQPGYKDLNYWQSQGVNAQDIFDTTTGQIKPGWARTGQGYERTGGSSSGGQQLSMGDPYALIKQLTNGRPPTPEQLEALAPELAKYGIRLGSKGNRGWTDTIILPDGRMFDIIEAAGIGTGKSWTWQQNGGPGYVDAGHYGGGVGQGVGLPNSQYNDPHTKLLEDLMLSRINALQQGTDPGYQQLMSYLDQRFKDLQGPGRTGAEQEVIRTQALDPIENDRQAAKKRLIERMAAAGHTMESGVMQMALMEVDKAFDSERATAQGTMATDELNRREGRNQRAEGLAASMYELPAARNREALGYSGALADLGPQRLQLAMQAAGMGGNPSNMFGSLMQLAQLNQQSALMNQNQQSQLWGGLGQLAYYMWNAGR